MTPEEKIQAALDVACRGQHVGESHHQTWVIDQMVRALTGDNYRRWVTDYCNGENGELADDPFEWDIGIPP